MKKKVILIILCYLAIYIIWSSTYYAIKVGLQSVSAMSMLGVRFILSGSILLIISIIINKGHILLKRKQIINSAFLGILLLLGGNGLVTISETRIDSYIAALIISTVPLVVTLFDRIIIKKKINIYQLAGILTGITGVGFILYHPGPISGSFNFYNLLLVCAVIFWSFGTSIGRKLDTHPDILFYTAVQMLTVGSIAFLILLIKGQSLDIKIFFFRPAIIPLGYLISFGTLALTAYMYLLKNEPALRISSYALVNPAFAVIIGIFIGKEEPAPYLFVGLPLLLLGIGGMLYGNALAKHVKKFIFSIVNNCI